MVFLRHPYANRVKILFTKMGSEGDLIGSANSIQINPSLDAMRASFGCCAAWLLVKMLCSGYGRLSSPNWVLGSDGTRNRGKPAIPFAELLLSAKKGRLRWNGLIFVRKSLLQKAKLVRQLLQRRGCKLLSCMLLCLKPVFCSNAP